jgi:hypothetical protein
MREVQRAITEFCRERRERAPSRATVYNVLARARTMDRRAGDLPDAVRRVLYNLDDESRVPDAQVAFYCFNYGDQRAISWGDASNVFGDGLTVVTSRAVLEEDDGIVQNERVERLLAWGFVIAIKKGRLELRRTALVRDDFDAEERVIVLVGRLDRVFEALRYDRMQNLPDGHQLEPCGAAGHRFTGGESQFAL